MDFSVLIGVAFGFGTVLTGFILEGGTLISLILISPMFIVFGGTIGACTVQFGVAEMLGIPSKIAYVFKKPKLNSVQLIELIVGMAEKSRREGILSLENEVNSNPAIRDSDPLLVKGISFAVDGTDMNTVRDILESEMSMFEHAKKEDSEIFEAAGAFGPTMGITGTVMGLVHILGNLDDPGSLGPSIAAAFIATLYGVAIANLIYLPLGGRIKGCMKRDIIQKQLMVEGILAIQTGENPRIVQERLMVFVSEHEKGHIKHEEK